MRPALKIFFHSFLLGPVGIIYLVILLVLIDQKEDFLSNGVIVLLGSIVCGFISFISSLIVFIPIYHYEKNVQLVRNPKQLFRAYLPVITLVMSLFGAVVIALNNFDYQPFLVSFLGAAYLISGTELYLFSRYLFKLSKQKSNGRSNRKI